MVGEELSIFARTFPYLPFIRGYSQSNVYTFHEQLLFRGHLTEGYPDRTTKAEKDSQHVAVAVEITFAIFLFL